MGECEQVGGEGQPGCGQVNGGGQWGQGGGQPPGQKGTQGTPKSQAGPAGSAGMAQGQWGPGMYQGQAAHPPTFQGVPGPVQAGYPGSMGPPGHAGQAGPGYPYPGQPPMGYGYPPPGPMGSPFPPWAQGYAPAPPGVGAAQHAAQHQGRGSGSSRLIEELAGGGSGLASLTQMFNLDDKELWKGALVGAAVVLLLTNESVQNTLFKTGAHARDAVRSGVDKVKARAREATNQEGTSGQVGGGHA